MKPYRPSSRLPALLLGLLPLALLLAWLFFGGAGCGEDCRQCETPKGLHRNTPTPAR